MNQPQSSNMTRHQSYIDCPFSDWRSRQGSLTMISRQSHTISYAWTSRGHTDTTLWCVSVCLCAIYVYSTLNLFHTIPVFDFLCLPSPFTIPVIRRLQCIPCYKLIAIPRHVCFLALVPSLCPLRSPLNLTLPRRKQCHHRPILQLRLLTDAHIFVPRAADFSHWEITPLAHIRLPLACQRPHRHYIVLCVCMFVRNIRLFNLKYIPHYYCH